MPRAFVDNTIDHIPHEFGAAVLKNSVCRVPLAKPVLHPADAGCHQSLPVHIQEDVLRNPRA